MYLILVSIPLKYQIAKYYNVNGEFVFNEKKKTNLNEEMLVANLYSVYYN